MTDWRDPALRRELFQRSYTFSLVHRNFPGMVYSMLPAIADHFDLDDEGRLWLAWLNGNTQNAVTSLMLLEASLGSPDCWRSAVDFWNDHFTSLEFDTDRRHQKAKFGEATEKWMEGGFADLEKWRDISGDGQETFRFAMAHPYMGRISAWSFMEFVRILLPWVPDVDGWYLKESSSRSHRNALCLLDGFEGAWGWDGPQAEAPFLLDLFEELDALAEDLLAEAMQRNATLGLVASHQEGVAMYDPHPDISRLTLESALCTFKSWHKPDRRYPNVYADMMYHRIKKAEARMGRDFKVLWDIRKETLPAFLRLEDNPYDPGLVAVKQNWFRNTGEVHYLHTMFNDMEPSGFELGVEAHEYGARKDPKWN